MIETMEVQRWDYLQNVFYLSSITEDGKLKQKIVHMQQEPAYRKEYKLSTTRMVSRKIFVIDDVTHCTMLRAE
jgi:hypothetical protein